MSAHTPGPWEVENSKDEHNGVEFPQGYNIVSEDGQYIVGDAGILEGEIDEANARLIAAAPELLEALRFVLTAHGEQLHDAFAMANAAIAKATGESA